MPGMDGTGPSGTGPIGWRHDRCRLVGLRFPAKMNPEAIPNQEQAGEILSRMDRGALPYGAGKMIRIRFGQRFRGGN